MLGEHALALALVTYIGGARAPAHPLQAGHSSRRCSCSLALVLYELVLFAIDGWTGHPVTSRLRWLHALTGALIWPPAAALFGYAAGRRA